jgi:hypothetical protein
MQWLPVILIGQKEDRVWGVAYQIGNVVFALHYSLLLVAFSCCRNIFPYLDDDIWERSVREQLDFREKVFSVSPCSSFLFLQIVSLLLPIVLPRLKFFTF